MPCFFSCRLGQHNVNTDGTLNRNNACNGNNGPAPRFDGSPDLLTARRRAANTVPHHPMKAYPPSSCGRLTGPGHGKHKYPSMFPGAGKSGWSYTRGGDFSMENIVNSTIALPQSIPQKPPQKARLPDRHAYRRGYRSLPVALSERLQRRNDSFLWPHYPSRCTEPMRAVVLAIDFEGQSRPAPRSATTSSSRQILLALHPGTITPARSAKGTHDGLDRLAAAMRHYSFNRKAADEAARKAVGLPPRLMNEWDHADGWVLKGDFSKFLYTLPYSYWKHETPAGP